MSEEQKPPRSPINIDIGARAEAKLELKGEIPSRSLGNLIDALTDAIRPFTESRGLRADQVRVQRAEVAIKIAELAQKKLAIEKGEIHPVSNKVLVPLIEKASNEDLSDEAMVERWSDLLVAACGERSIPPLYVQILSEMDGKQANCLARIMMNEYQDWYRPYRTFADSFLTNDASLSREHLRQDTSSLPFGSRKQAYSFIVDYFSRPGVYLYYVDEEGHFDSENLIRAMGVWYEAGAERDLEICCALGLLKKEEIELDLRYLRRINRVRISYFRCTGIGVEFLQACDRARINELDRRSGEIEPEFAKSRLYERAIYATRKKTRSKFSNSVR